ncbi:helix-turn-helix domain-containing protein [Paenactinomyces guangxiensis]|nr:AraC family transcriptional regulator [Paenactinomyces guangxiensis]MBH8590661.1 helix-turn-helix transcriptional regulator [Paenactinomyces guangxiensis]
MQSVFKREEQTEKFEGRGRRPLELSPVEHIKRYVQEHVAETISLSEAATKVYLNPNYFSQLFKQQTGQSFVRYVTEIKMDKAKELLIHTSLRVSEVAERVGYMDVAYFSNTFKKMVGEAPSEYRRKHAGHSGERCHFREKTSK